VSIDLKLLTFLITSFLIPFTNAQTFLNANTIQFGTGFSSLLGDLGGSTGMGTNFVRDFDPQSVRISSSTTLCWTGKDHLEYCAGLSHLFLSADDKYSEERSRKERNLSVSTSVVELSPSIKYNFYSKYNQARFHQSKHAFTDVYVSVGIGFIYFNPKARLGGRVYNLEQFSTEGQGLTGGPKRYSKYSVVIPFKLGFRQDVGILSSMFLELTTRKSFTDYLDDVSTVYHDNSKISASNGKVAAALADRNTSGSKHPPGLRRGNSQQNDSYFSIEIGYRRTLVSPRKLAKYSFNSF